MLWIRSHTKYAVNNGQLSSMNVLQVVCQKPHGAKPMASPINNSFTGREFSGRKLTNRWNLKALLLPLLPSVLMLRKKIFPSCFCRDRPVTSEIGYSTFRPDVIIHSGDLSVEIANTASEELLRKLWGIIHV